MPSREEVIKRTIKLVKTYVPKLADQNINEDSIINTDMNVDSMEFIYVMVKIESEFHISVPQKKWDRMKTVKDVVDSIMRELKKAK